MLGKIVSIKSHQTSNQPSAQGNLPMKISKRSSKICSNNIKKLSQKTAGNVQKPRKQHNAINFRKHKTKEKLLEKSNKLIEKISTTERNLFSLKKDIEVIPTTKPSWSIEIENKLVNFQDRSRRNNLRINAIKEGKNEGKLVNCFLEEKLDIDTSDIWI